MLNNRIYRLYRYAIYLLLFTRAIRKAFCRRLYRHFVALRCCAAHWLRPKDTMLIDWRSRPTFMQADFHARQKIAHKNVRVNCNIYFEILACGKLEGGGKWNPMSELSESARKWIHLPPPEFCYTLYPTLYFLKSVVYDGNTLLKTLKTPQFPQHSKWQIFTQFPQNVRKNA